MTTAVIGSRTFQDYVLLENTLNKYMITQLVSGGARGADQLAERYAHKKGLPTLVLKPDYATFGKAAPFICNQDIIDAVQQVIAFWNGESRGTAHALKYAQKQGKIVHIISFAG